jgi:hypothetical protein
MGIDVGPADGVTLHPIEFHHEKWQSLKLKKLSMPTVA